MQFMRHLLPFFLLLMIATGVQAVELGRVVVPLDSRSADAVAQAEVDALTKVLVQLTGQQEVQALPGVDVLLQNAHQQLSQYTYGTSTEGGQTLEALFDVQRLARALMEAGTPVWSLSRPDVLLWLVDASGSIVQEDEPLLGQARDRGLPLLLPEQLDGVSPSDIRGRFIEPVYEASRQQKVELFVTAVMYGGTKTTLRWWLYQQQEVLTQHELVAASATEAKQALADELANFLAKRYAVKAGEEGVFHLAVNGIKRLTDWHALDERLQNLTGVEQVITTRIRGETAYWQLAFSGGREQLERLLSVNRHLTPCEMAHSTPSPATIQTAVDEAPVEAAPVPTTLSYCWR